jgi:beta-glucanase (GH16 family)
MNRAEAIKAIAGCLFSLKECGRYPAAVTPVSARLADAGAPGRGPPPASDRIPTVSLIDTEVDPNASEAHVEVRLSGPVFSTVAVSVLTRNSSDLVAERRAIAGYQFNYASQLFIFRPGDDPWRSLTVPLLGGKDGQWFEVVITGVDGAGPSASVCRITFRTGAKNSARPSRQRAPAQAPRQGAPTFELNLADFHATDTGRIDGKPCWRTRFHHGRTQTGNSEIGLYTDPVLHPGTRSFEVRDGALRLRVEKLARPILFEPEGREYAYGTSVLTSQALFNQLYGYYEWDARLSDARGTWSGLWLVPADGSWPPEIDVMEAPRNGEFGKSDSNAASHWVAGGVHLSVASKLQADRILGRPINLVDDFHRHSVDWRPDYTTWFIDDVEVWQAPTRFHVPAMAMMDVAVGGWAGAPDFSTGSTEMQVRSFRVWP